MNRETENENPLAFTGAAKSTALVDDAKGEHDVGKRSTNIGGLASTSK